MIISHKYKFIFIKTKKVAGTSLEVALSKYCANSDILSTHGSDKLREKLGFTTARNYKKKVNEMTLREFLGSFYYKRLRKKYYSHMPAAKIRQHIGEDTWDRYFKFTVVRNPFDKLVSQYYWKKRNSQSPVSFKDYLRENLQLIRENWNLYTINNEVLVDDCVKFENLELDLKRISEKIGLPENVFHVMNNFDEKANIRPNNSTYRDIIEEEEKNIISMCDREEINLFEYEF